VSVDLAQRAEEQREERIAEAASAAAGVSSLLPPDVRKRLVEAGQITDPKERNRAIEEAIRRARVSYPQFFKEEQES
jgi:predicted nuclease of restriction endonuclease-like RecB superfamily